MTLSLFDTPLGTVVEVNRFDVEAAWRLRLAELGVRRNSRVRPVQRTTGGGRVIAVGSARVALDKNICRRVLVDPVADTAAETTQETLENGV